MIKTTIPFLTLGSIMFVSAISCKPEKKETNTTASQEKTSEYANPLDVEFGDP